MAISRLTISLDESLADDLKTYMQRNGYGNRSEAFRDLVRAAVEADRLETQQAVHCVGCLTYVYDHDERELPQRLARLQHRYHDLTVCTTHVHLDHDTCLETLIVRGDTVRVKRLAGDVLAQPGVRHGHLHLVPAEVEVDDHRHDGGDHSGRHTHSRLRT